jgi:hypothetical protein
MSSQSEGASEGTVVFEMPIELVSMGAREQPSPYGGMLSVGNNEVKVEGETYTKVLAVLDFSGTCPGGAGPQDPITGSYDAELGRIFSGAFQPTQSDSFFSNLIGDYGFAYGLNIYQFQPSSHSFAQFGVGAEMHHAHDVFGSHVDLPIQPQFMINFGFTFGPR